MEAYKNVAALNKPVVLVTHVPLEPEDGSGLLLKRCREVYGDSYDKTSGLFIGENGCKPNRTTREFLHLILADDSPVVLVISGHIHFYHKENLNENTVEIVSGPAFAGEALRIRLL